MSKSHEIPFKRSEDINRDVTFRSLSAVQAEYEEKGSYDATFVEITKDQALQLMCGDVMEFGVMGEYQVYLRVRPEDKNNPVTPFGNIVWIDGHAEWTCSRIREQLGLGDLDRHASGSRGDEVVDGCVCQRLRESMYQMFDRGKDEGGRKYP